MAPSNRPFLVISVMIVCVIILGTLIVSFITADDKIINYRRKYRQTLDRYQKLSVRHSHVEKLNDSLTVDKTSLQSDKALLLAEKAQWAAEKAALENQLNEARSQITQQSNSLILLNANLVAHQNQNLFNQQQTSVQAPSVQPHAIMGYAPQASMPSTLPYPPNINFNPQQ